MRRGGGWPGPGRAGRLSFGGNGVWPRIHTHEPTQGPRRLLGTVGGARVVGQSSHNRPADQQTSRPDGQNGLLLWLGVAQPCTSSSSQPASQPAAVGRRLQRLSLFGGYDVDAVSPPTPAPGGGCINYGGVHLGGRLDLVSQNERNSFWGKELVGIQGPRFKVWLPRFGFQGPGLQACLFGFFSFFADNVQPGSWADRNCFG